MEDQYKPNGKARSARAVQTGADASEALGSPSAAGAVGVLVIQADTAARERLGALLEAEGCRVTAVASLEAALAAPPPSGYAFAIVDCQLPEARGFEIGQRLREAEVTQVVVGLTAGLSTACRDRGCGLDDVLSKPGEGGDVRALLACMAVLDTTGTTPRDADADDRGEACPNAIPAQSSSWAEGMDPATAARLVELFVSDARLRMARIEQYVQGGRVEEARWEIHALKSGAMQVGAGVVTGCCELLSAAIRAGSPGLSQGALQRLEEAVEASRRMLG